MATDPGLSNDTCIFMESVSGDGGARNTNDVWWLSPDIELVGPVSGLDNADAGQNHTTVKFHRKPASSNCVFPGDESLVTELWVANPSLVMSPHLTQSVVRVELTGSELPPEGESATQPIDWRTRGGSAAEPLSPGHKCLVARVYPSSLVPNPTHFFPGDQHIAQHNLCTVVTTETAFSFTVNACGSNILREQLTPTPAVKLRAVLDLHPSNFVKNTVLSRLGPHSGFQQLSTVPLKGGFKFDVANLHPSAIVDHSHPAVLPPFPPGANPSFEADVVLDPQQVTQITFLANLKGLLQNQACIFHLTQVNLDRMIGGLTLVVLKH